MRHTHGIGEALRLEYFEACKSGWCKVATTDVVKNWLGSMMRPKEYELVEIHVILSQIDC